MNKFKIVLIFTFAILLPRIAFSAVIYESAQLGPTGSTGGAGIGHITTNQWMLGSRFSLSNITQITAIGGHIINQSLDDDGHFVPDAKIFGAIISLESPSAFPSFLPSEIGAHAIATTTFMPGSSLASSKDLRIPLSILLEPGEYAIIFGTGLLGANGMAAMPLNNPLFPEATFFLGATENFWNPIFAEGLGMRFVVEGILTLKTMPWIPLLLLDDKSPRADYPNTVIDTISVGDWPRGVAVTLNGSYVYVANYQDHTVSVIRTSDNTVIDTISVGNWPNFIAITPNGSYVYVGNEGDGTVSVIRTSDNTVIDTISVGNSPDGGAVTPNGSYVYVANLFGDTVSVIRTSDNTVIDTISVGDGPLDVAITSNGSYVYVGNFYGNTVSVIRTSDNTVIDTISAGNLHLPVAVAVTLNGSYVYVANYQDHTVSVIRTSDNTVIDTISVGDGPHTVAITPNGSYVYVGNEGDGTVSVIRTSDNTVIDTISVGGSPQDLAVTLNGSNVYVTNFDDTVSVIGFSN